MAENAARSAEPWICATFSIIIILIAAPSPLRAQVQSSSTLTYDFQENLECPTHDDSPDVNSREGVFSDFFRMGVECATGQGVFSSHGWPSGEVKTDSIYVGFVGEAPGDAPLSFGEGSQISFTVGRSSEGPVRGELLSYVDYSGDPNSIGIWLNETETQDISYSLSHIGVTTRIDFRFHGWAATSNSGTLDVDDVVLSFAIAMSDENTPELSDDFILSEAYPNPLTSAAFLPIVLGRASNVRIEILDVLGRCRKIEYDGRLVRGQHMIAIDGDDLPSGTYFIRLSTPDRQIMQPIVVTR